METSGGTFTLKGTTPSNRYVDSVATSVTSEEVTFSLDGTFMSEAGYYKHCYVEYRKDDQILTTQDIIFFSLGVSDISQGQADEYVSQLEELIRKYNETFDAFMAEIKGRVDSLNKQITDLTGQAKTLQDKLDALKEEISKLGNLQVMYSNSIDFGDYDYSGNPNLSAKLNASSFSLGSGATVADDKDEIVFTLDGTNQLSKYARKTQTPLVEGKQYTISCEIMLEDGFTGDPSGLRLQHAFFPGGNLVLQTTTVPKNELNTWQKLVGTKTINYDSKVPNEWYPIFRDIMNLKPTGKVRLRNIKIEEGSTVTPYQPNLLDAPYYLSKVTLGENIADPTISFPIKTSAYRLYGANMLEEFKIGQRYTLTMKANKPVSQTFWAYNGGNISLERMTPVEGLVDVWSCSFTPLTVDTSSPRLLSIYQAPQSTVGTCQIDWLKIEKGDTRTPNIEQYKYRGIGMRDSNNPKDYVWDLAPEYVEAEVTKKVAQVNSQLKEHVNDTNNPHEVTKNQVGLGNVDNFSTATQTEAEKGEASNKFMTPQRTTQMITKRIATDAEVVAGTDLNKLVTPKSLDIYYRDRTQVAVASYGTEDIALTAKEELSEASWRYRRIGDIVEFYGRFKLKEATDIVNVHELPTGFRLSTDFDDTSWNVPLNIQKAANPTSYVAGAFVERQGTNLLRVGGNSSGNHYVSGWWYTDDPFPTG
ncbi:hypothetical protein ACH0B4_12200 [Enterococcus hirae]|uniref:hypothetical protein n=1 Tax=Enterococcus hirae TaxID=1354 RepID=UPI00387A6AD6